MESILSLFLGILWFLFIKSTPAEASLYPTKPIANTTYIAGQAAKVTWVEDGTRPLLSRVGKMKIDLFAANNTFLAALAKDIDPLALSTTIFIPSSMIPAHYHRFNLRFKAASPANSSSVPSLVYTADFSITPNPLSVQSVFPLPTSTSGNTMRTSNSSTSSFSESTSVHPSVMMPTPASRLAPSPTAGTVGKGKSGAVGRGLNVMQGSIHIHGWNSEEMKFRLVFIIWPALIGLSMAV
ncbi:hypothetical protein BYT27DRAFT_7149036 [Phlegmacium glaucopus]|nr:hypothetical protein BYT27DRAFT_7149036 [Phlegmacium glaucopus]